MENTTLPALEQAMQWKNPPSLVQPLPEGGLRVATAAGTDYFANPAGGDPVCNAHYWFLEAPGDFLFTATVRPDCTTRHDGGALIAWANEDTWAKLCLEWMGAGLPYLSTTVTHGRSDDAGHGQHTADAARLTLARLGGVVAMYVWEENAGCQRMLRFFPFEAGTIRLGVAFQCPIGPGGAVDLLDISYSPVGPKDLFAGA